MAFSAVSCALSVLVSTLVVVLLPVPSECQPGDPFGLLRTTSMVLTTTSKPFVYCPLGHFRCESGECLSKYFLCNRSPECKDESDETVERCGPFSCLQDQVKCPTFSKCIAKTWICDTEPDCPDGWDETDHNCNQTCVQNKFMCNTRKEFNTTKGSLTAPHCILPELICNGMDDCGDNSDELTVNCTEHGCPTEMFKCNSGRCITGSYVCDMDNDCGDLSDEQNCTYKSCLPHQFQCGTGRCVWGMFKCDGEQDCNDGSDELGCATLRTEQRTCVPGVEFVCKDGACINSEYRCDMDRDCADNSDETNCTEACAAGQFKCHTSHECIFTVELCNDRVDCSDGSDELDCGNQLYTTTTTFSGLMSRLGQPCTPDLCAQLCEPLPYPPAYQCKCYDNFELDGLGSGDCLAKGPEMTLFLGLKTNIRNFYPEDYEDKILVRNITALYALDYIYHERYVFWSDRVNKNIIRCSFPSSVAATVEQTVDAKKCTVILSNVNVDHFAVDWIYNLLFWTDASTQSVSVISLDLRSQVKTLYHASLDEPRHIAVDPEAGLLFWCEVGQTPRVMLGAMDGSMSRAIVTVDVKEPVGITLDLYAKRVYWLDAKLRSAYNMKYDGSDRQLVFQDATKLYQPYSATFFASTLYWTDLQLPGIHEYNVFKKEFKTYFPSLPGPIHVRVVQAQAQPEFPNQCAIHDCPELCLPVPVNDVGPPAAAARSHNCTATDSNSPSRFTTTPAPSSRRWTFRPNNGPWRGPRRGSQTSRGTVAAVVIVVLIIVAAVIAGGYIYWRRRQQRQQFVARSFDNPLQSVGASSEQEPETTNR